MGADRVNFEDGWSFLQTGLHVTMAEAESAAARFVPVELPHDWLIGDVRNLYLDSCGWYRKSFFWQGEDAAVLLGFDGVYMDCTVYVNGTRIGDWKYGYSSFHMDITRALRPGGELRFWYRCVFRHPTADGIPVPEFTGASG